MMSRCIAPLAVLAAAWMLSACGQGNSAVPTSRYVYVSSADCAEGGQIKPEDCTKAVDKALAEHDKIPLRFPTLADCEKAEGFDRCERVTERHWRPRLMAFQFSVRGASITAIPLYAGLRGATVLRDVAGNVLDWERTDGVTFSREAVLKSQGLAPFKRGRAS